MNTTTFFFRTFTILATLFSLLACTSKGNSGLSGFDGTNPNFGSNPFGGGMTAGDLNNSIGSSGGLTGADQAALSNMTNGMQNVNPQAGGGLPQDLLDEAKQLLDQQANSDASDPQQQAQMQAMKMSLVGKILQKCAQQIAPLAPIPGQPLMGVWSGGGACPVNFQVASTGPQPVYKVSGTAGAAQTDSKSKKATKDNNGYQGGALDGQMAAYPDGHGEVKADPFQGNLTDSPQAGSGKLIHPTANKTKSGASPCEVAVQLKSSTNPIPENYIEAMRQAGKCHRQALMFMSPVIDGMFRNMDPQLANLLMQQAIGVGK